MYNERDVAGVDTHMQLTLMSVGRQVHRVVISVENNLGAAYLANNVFEAIAPAFDVPGAQDVPELFAAYAANPKIRSISTDLARISTIPKNKADGPDGTAMVVGRSRGNELESRVCVMAYNAQSSEFIASIPNRRRAKQQLELICRVFTSTTGRTIDIPSLESVTVDGPYETESWTLTKTVYETRTLYTIKIKYSASTLLIL